MDKKPYNAFLSYSRKDGVEFAERLKVKLLSDGKGSQLKYYRHVLPKGNGMELGI